MNTDINTKDYSGWARIHYAVASENMDSITEALASGANINLKSNLGNTPLYIAICRSIRIEIVEYLVSSGADFTIKNNAGKSPNDIVIPLFDEYSEKVKQIFKDHANFPHSKQCLEY